jgi:integrase-like protein
VPRPAPLPHQRGSRLEPAKAGSVAKNGTETMATVSRSDAVQEARGFLVEVTWAIGLEPICQDAKQQVPRQRLRRLAPEHGPPSRAQGWKIEIAQGRDLVFLLASIDHRAGGCYVPARPAAVGGDFLFRLRTNLLLQNAGLLLRPHLATEGLNAFQATAGEAQRHGATIVFTSPDRHIAAGAHRFDEPEIKQFLDDLLRAPPLKRGGSIAQWSSRCEAAERTIHWVSVSLVADMIGILRCWGATLAPSPPPPRFGIKPAGQDPGEAVQPRTTTLMLRSQENASPFCDHLRRCVVRARSGTCRLSELQHAADNGLVAGSSPPGPTTQSERTVFFLVIRGKWGISARIVGADKLDLDHARQIITAWVADYNTTRPRSSLGYKTPAAYADHLTATDHRAALREGSARWSVAHTAPKGVSTVEALLDESSVAGHAR